MLGTELDAPTPLLATTSSRVAGAWESRPVTYVLHSVRVHGSEAVFDDVSLAEAIAEVNRYDRTQIVLVGDASLARLRVSGVYRTGDTAGFARDVAALHGLVVHEREGRLELAKPQ